MMKQQTWSDVLRRGFNLQPMDSKMALPELVSAVSKAVSKHLATSADVQEYLSRLPKGARTACPDSPTKELVKYVADRPSKIDKSDPAVNLRFMEQIVQPVFVFEHETLLGALIRNSNISPGDLLLLQLGAMLAKNIDKLWAKWFERVVVPFQSLSEEKKNEYEKVVKAKLGEPNFDYTVFDVGEEWQVVGRKTWAQAYPDIIQRIVFILDSIESRCEQLETRAYLQALRRAYSCVEIEQLEEMWAEVDRTWVSIPNECQIILVHGMENGYEHPFGVSPEFRIEVRTAGMQDMINTTRRATIEYARQTGLDEEIVRLVEEKLNRMDIGAFVHAIRGGVCANFRYAGQVVPNRQEILGSLGGRIFLDRDVPVKAAKHYQEQMIEHCLPETTQELKELITAGCFMSTVIGHECFHPVGCSPEIDQLLGSTKEVLEEAKATIGGLLVAERQQPTPERRLELIAVSVARLLRFFDKTTLNNPTAAPYVRENLVVANTLFETGVIVLTQKGLHVDRQKAQTKVWFELLKEFVNEVIQAYGSEARQEKIPELQSRYCKNKEGTPVGDLIAWVNRSK